SARSTTTAVSIAPAHANPAPIQPRRPAGANAAHASVPTAIAAIAGTARPIVNRAAAAASVAAPVATTGRGSGCTTSALHSHITPMAASPQNPAKTAPPR